MSNYKLLISDAKQDPMFKMDYAPSPSKPPSEVLDDESEEGSNTPYSEKTLVSDDPLSNIREVSKNGSYDAALSITVPSIINRNRRASLGTSLMRTIIDSQQLQSNGPESLYRKSMELQSHLDSRSISKTDLSNVVCGVRELEKKLNKVFINMTITNIMLVVKIQAAEPIELSHKVAEYLLSQKKEKITVYIQDKIRYIECFEYEKLISKDPSYEPRIKFWRADLCTYSPDIFDLVITIGGDGTVLFASWIFQNIVPPMLCLGQGSLGFLTEFKGEDYKEAIDKVLSRGCQCTLRMRFDCTVYRCIPKDGDKLDRDLNEEIRAGEDAAGNFKTHEKLETNVIFNDLVIDRGPNPSMTITELYGDFDHLTTIEADGVVIATPSGSTAYSLSAGGSLVHPTIPGILVSPICPHTLSFRPLVIPDTVTVRVGVPYDARSTVWCGFDGKNRVELNIGDFVTISASRYPVPTVTSSGSNTYWFKGLSNTLHWNERKRQKPLHRF